jgi:hypothetical protein
LRAEGGPAPSLRYIIVCRFGIAEVFALLERILWRKSWRIAFVADVAGGSSIFGCYVAAFQITDRVN